MINYIALLDGLSQNLQKTKDFLNQTTINTVTSLTEATDKAKGSLHETAEKAQYTFDNTTSQAINILNQAANKALGTVAETAEKAKNSLSTAASQAANNVTLTTNKAVESVTQTTEKAKDVITNTAGQAVNSVNQVTNKALGTVTEITEKAKGALSETTNKAVANINEVSEKAKASLEETIQKTEGLSLSFSEGIQTAINSFINDWLNKHPLILWIWNHPLPSLAVLFFIILLVIFLVSGLLRAITSLSEKTWISIFQVPFKLLRAMLGLGHKSVDNVRRNELVTAGSGLTFNPSERQERVVHILSRLDTIKQEQELLIQELATLIK
ncbi:hypothetical protein ACE1CD_02120 [Aerosakkonema sp. BLCC-F183]|uniref:hypothetical protein n=1 Tax=Aerosakkonema sp. BLCC-F183 TaxID=3342834 RepID=UPI0035BA4C3C